MSVVSAIAMACIAYLLGVHVGTTIRRGIPIRGKKASPSDYSRAMQQVMANYDPKNIKNVEIIIETEDAQRN